jgi:ketosteroid isomerase-like protein
LERAASQVRDGELIRTERISDYATEDLAYTLEIERAEIKLGGSDEIVTTSLRVTTIFRREDGKWRIVHRHADPITSPRPIESVLQQ